MILIHELECTIYMNYLSILTLSLIEFKELVSEQTDNDRVLLEVGCGTGR